VPKATKRERQRQNREMRREAMMQAEKRRKRFRTARTIGLLLIPIVIIFVIIQLVSGGGSDSSSAASIKCSSRKPTTPVKTQTFPEVPATTIDVTAQYSAVLHTSCGDIEIALDAKQAPVTVNSFLFLIQNEYYNGTTFTRIVTDFVDQGGSQTTDGNGEPGYTLPLEPPKAGYKVGDVAMAARSDGSISGSQFFLVVSKNGADQLGTQPPYKYSILGHMDAHSLKVAQKINTFGTADQTGTPTKTIYVFDVGIIPPQGSSTSTTSGETTTAPAEETTLAP
jgi:peptidyl-prolyl cis-trans isomerase B (cyclophilin B)